jgi:hypothetical protein
MLGCKPKKKTDAPAEPQKKAEKGDGCSCRRDQDVADPESKGGKREQQQNEEPEEEDEPLTIRNVCVALSLRL